MLEQSRAKPRTPAGLFPVGDARTLAVTVAWLRPCAVAGQLLALVVVVRGLGVNLPLEPLLGGIAVLALAVPLAFWRLRQPWPVGEAETCGHITFDVLQLGWVLYFTGGAANPFITLLLLPVALAAAALSLRGTLAVMVLAVGVYSVLIFHNVPLPDMTMGRHGFRLHLAGMAVNFVVAVLLLAVFIGRMRASLNAQREAVRGLRERMLRNEGIMAIATQAADTAHRLNTPLSTLRTLLPELEHGREEDPDLREDVRMMIGEVDRCRDDLRRMVDYGRQQLADNTQTVQLGPYVRDNAERFRLLCPEAELDVRVASDAETAPVVVQPGVAHALLNLLQNAYDASHRNASTGVRLEVERSAAWAQFSIEDQGGGPAATEAVRDFAVSDKADGLGIGLALAQSTIERLRGDVHTTSGAAGTRVVVRLPLAVE